MGVFSLPNPIPSTLPVLIKPKRGIQANGSGSLLIADAAVEEQHQDDMQITEHPVEQGTVVADHAYKMPAVLILTYGWSESSPGGKLDPNYLKGIYQQLLDYQGNRTLLLIYTGKRLYSNMIIQSLVTSTDKNTEHVLLVRITCRELIIAITQVVQMTDQSSLALPENTTAIQNQGTKQLGTPPVGTTVP